MTGSKTTLIFVVIVAIVCINISKVDSACYFASGCFEPETNTTYNNGESWTTSSCAKCGCYTFLSREETRYCVELVSEASQNQATSVKKSAQPSARFEESSTDFVQLLYSTKDVVLNADDVFNCPTIPLFDFGNQQLNIVTYNIHKNKTESSCCTASVPTYYPDDCERVFVKESCSYILVDKATRGPCVSGPMSWVGK